MYYLLKTPKRFHHQRYERKITFSLLLFILLGALFPTYASNPASTNYELKDYGFGSGGTVDAKSTNYGVFGVVGENESGNGVSTNFKSLDGLTYTTQSNLPPAPTVSNPASYYDKLKVVINIDNNPTDTLYAIAASTDDFQSDIKYVQADGTLSPSLTSGDWQTYAAWGGSSGSLVIGLGYNTTYSFKVAAKQGQFTQTGFGPSASVATAQSSLTFDIDVAPTDQKTDPPYTVNFGSLSIGSVNTAANKVWVDLSTNANNGAFIYIYDAYAGLKSTNTNYTISSQTGNLSSLSEGFGIRNSSTSQSSGGPIIAQSPYDGSNDNIGQVDTTIRTLYSSSNNPITSGRASFLLKTKASTTTPASNDYTDSLTVIASATF